MNPATRERIARALCRASLTDQCSVCPECLNGECTLWPQFQREAEVAFSAVRDEFMLTRRTNRRAR